MKGWLILRHAIRQVAGNLPEALQLTVFPYAISVVLSFVSTQQMGTLLGNPQGASLGASFALLISALVMVVVSVWVAVIWHRFVLLNDRPKSFVPEFPRVQVFSYLGRSIGYGFVLLAAMMVVNMVVALFILPSTLDQTSLVDPATAEATRPSRLLVFLINVLVQTPVMALAFRLMSVLPAAALQRDVPFFAGWNTTKGAGADFLVLAFICTVVTYGLSEVAGLIFADLQIFLYAWDVVFNWVITVVGASVLTTLYGHYVEGRELV